MEIVLAYVGLAGFALSLLNLFLIFWQRRVALKAERAIIIVSNHGHVYLDMVVSNRSGLPISVTSADLLDDHNVWIRGDANTSDMLTTTNGETGEKLRFPSRPSFPSLFLRSRPGELFCDSLPIKHLIECFVGFRSVCLGYRQVARHRKIFSARRLVCGCIHPAVHARWLACLK